MPSGIEHRIRHLIDRMQVLMLTRPLVAVWLLDWLDLFLGKHLE